MLVHRTLDHPCTGFLAKEKSPPFQFASRIVCAYMPRRLDDSPFIIVEKRFDRHRTHVNPSIAMRETYAAFVLGHPSIGMRCYNTVGRNIVTSKCLRDIRNISLYCRNAMRDSSSIRDVYTTTDTVRIEVVGIDIAGNDAMQRISRDMAWLSANDIVGHNGSDSQRSATNEQGCASNERGKMKNAHIAMIRGRP